MLGLFARGERDGVGFTESEAPEESSRPDGHARRVVLHEQRHTPQRGPQPARLERTDEAVQVHDIGVERDDVVDDVGAPAHGSATVGRAARHMAPVVDELVAHAVALDHLVAPCGQHYC